MKEVNKAALPVAQDFLAAAQGHLGDRASTYDNPGGERSMGRTVNVLAALTATNSQQRNWFPLPRNK